MAVSEIGARAGRWTWMSRGRALALRRTMGLGRGFKRILTEPLFHFLVAGLLLFVAGEAWRSHVDTYRIVITPRHVQQLANDYALQFGGQPDPATLDALVTRDVHDEMLMRQGLALGLGKDDEIVRRRIVQKMQFLMQDLDAPPEPTDAQLQAYYNAHAARYVTPPRASFSHIYFSADQGGDEAARARAQAVLRALPDTLTRAPDRGDAFPDLYDFSAYEPEQVERLFGQTPFAKAVFTAPTGHWAGPFKSGYGWHLVYVAARQAPAAPPLASVRDTVRTDYLQDAQDVANQKAFDKLARRFTVVRQDRQPAR
jgi:hypothetical protein